MKSIQDTFTLENGVKIPIMALGTWESKGEKCYETVLEALEMGYTHIDTAAIYENEKEIGKAIKDSNVKREDLFITTKLWNNAHSYEKAIEAFNESLERLGLDYIDLYLIHWPNPLEYRDDWIKANAEAWKAMEKLYHDGKIKAIGVSNFKIDHLNALFETALVKPMVNQIRICPGDTKEQLVEWCKNNGILIEAYSPFARGEVFESRVLKDIAAKHGKTKAQVVLRWCLEKGYVSLPKTVHKERLEENMNIFDFTLSNHELKEIDNIKTKYDKYSNEPDDIDF